MKKKIAITIDEEIYNNKQEVNFYEQVIAF